MTSHKTPKAIIHTHTVRANPLEDLQEVISRFDSSSVQDVNRLAAGLHYLAAEPIQLETVLSWNSSIFDAILLTGKAIGDGEAREQLYVSLCQLQSILLSSSYLVKKAHPPNGGNGNGNGGNGKAVHKIDVSDKITQTIKKLLAGIADIIMSIEHYLIRSEVEDHAESLLQDLVETIPSDRLEGLLRGYGFEPVQHSVAPEVSQAIQTVKREIHLNPNLPQSKSKTTYESVLEMFEHGARGGVEFDRIKSFYTDQKATNPQNAANTLLNRLNEKLKAQGCFIRRRVICDILPTNAQTNQ